MTSPTEPTAEARQMAGMVWDHFRALTQRGFTEQQALVLLGNMLGTAIANQSNDKQGTQ